MRWKQVASPYPSPYKPQKPTPAEGSDSLDVAPDYHIEKKVDEERAETKEIDLLDSDRPVE